MRQDEFIPIAADMQARWWSFPIPGTALDQYVRDLADLEAVKVSAALHSLAADGLDRPPSSGQIRRRIAELELNAPTWDEARTALAHWRRGGQRRRQALETWTCSLGTCDGSRSIPTPDDEKAVTRCGCRADYVRALRGFDELPPLLAEFVADEHTTPAELEAFLDRGDRTAESQVRGRFAEFVGRAVSSRALAGLPDAGLPRMLAAQAEDQTRRARHGELRRLGASEIVGLLEEGHSDARAA